MLYTYLNLDFILLQNFGTKSDDGEKLVDNSMSSGSRRGIQNQDGE